ncbi:uncharacterized protein DUF955 [Murinocardiopsis flavida]|uniref:Uncharacterized protein DUF955 n=2 Tax=Murinocardiopsis flavida TaxID=645275 RepID=A0A2P8DH22_9ACTN|nr:uncharacterized protein DUF955 [Murinocardiopsis flavida]
MISKLESGDRRIDAIELTRLAQALDVPLNHFLHQAPEVVSRRATAVLDIGDVGETQVDRDAYRTEVLLAEWLRDVRQLTESGHLTLQPMLRYPRKVTGSADAHAAAHWLRDRLGIGRNPVESVADACEMAGQSIAVIRIPSDGAALVDGDTAVAVVDLAQQPGRRRSTAAHELGHMVLGDEFSTDLGVHASRDTREAVVEEFAAEFLLPHAVTRGIADQTAEEGKREALIRLSAIYRVSWSLTLHQAKNARVIDTTQARRLKTRVPTFAEFQDALGWRPQPDLDSVRVPPRYASAVMQAFKAHHVTATRAVEMLRGQISTGDLSDD